MNDFVVDSGVLVKAFLPEEYSEMARRIIKDSAPLAAPDLIWIEAANVIWKRTQRGDISPHDAPALLEDMLRAPIDTHSSFNLVRRAAALAAETGRSIYDCMYLALALRDGLVFLTADERFYNALKNGPYAAHIRWLGE